jgi:hypothetical protein
VRGTESAGEFDQIAQLGAPNLGDEDLDCCLLIGLLLRHILPPKGPDYSCAVGGPASLGVVPVELAGPDLKVHTLPLYSDLACRECVPALLGSNLHGLVDDDLVRSVVETWVTSALEDLLTFEDEALSCHYGPISFVHDNLELCCPHRVVVCLGVLAVHGRRVVDRLRLQLVWGAVVHSEAGDMSGL